MDFIGKPEQNTTLFFIIKKKKKEQRILEFSQNSLDVS